MLLTRFIHLFGMSMWIGGMMAAMVLSSGAKVESGPVPRAAVFKWIGRVYSLVVGPGALITVVTGLILTVSLAQRMGGEVMARPGIWVMQAAGLLAAVLALFVALPAAANLARMASSAGDGEPPPAFGGLQRRLSAVVHVVAVLVVLSLFFAVVIR